ncbi:MAG TPA: 2,3-diaminopropionate biosynthesis protein SbnA [Pyrinomonadaceae bacterium]|jgi:cysteine synthase A
MREGILSAIGRTPLVRLERFFPDLNFNLYAKLESLNPGGSTKDRPAISIISRGIEMGLIKPDTVIVESSSGNMGIGLAQACAYFNLRFICVVDAKTTLQNIELLRAYGVEVDVVTEPDPVTGEYLQARMTRVETLTRSIENSFWPNQYANIYNPIAHYQTMDEITNTLDGRVDYLFCATSTCGTLRGCVEYVRKHDMSTKVFAVDALGSVIFGGQSAKRLIPGHGAAVRPSLYKPELAECIYISDPECVIGCRRLVKHEAILAGGSSGAVLMAVDLVKANIRPGSNCVVILADRGERYLDTIYSDAWVEKHFGDISHSWLNYAEAQPQCEPATI